MMEMGLNMHYEVLNTPEKMGDQLPNLERCRQPTQST